MLDEDVLLLVPTPALTEDDLPDSDEQPVDNELQVLVPALLRTILAYIWGGRFDWFFGVNMGVYYDTDQPAIGPDGFLSLGVERVRPSNKLRLSYVVAQEKVVPQWVLEVVSQKPGGEYTGKFQRYALMGVLYYTIYNPSHYRRDKHDVLEVYKLEQGNYVRQIGNPVWMPEIGLGIGQAIGSQEGIRRDWLYWYDDQGTRYPGPEETLHEERILREREQLVRREAQERLAQAEQVIEQERLQASHNLEQERRSAVLKMLQEAIPLETIARITGFSTEQLQKLQAEMN